MKIPYKGYCISSLWREYCMSRLEIPIIYLIDSGSPLTSRNANSCVACRCCSAVGLLDFPGALILPSAAIRRRYCPPLIWLVRLRVTLREPPVYRLPAQTDGGIGPVPAGEQHTLRGCLAYDAVWNYIVSGMAALSHSNPGSVIQWNKWFAVSQLFFLWIICIQTLIVTNAKSKWQGI